MSPSRQLAIQDLEVLLNLAEDIGCRDGSVGLVDAQQVRLEPDVIFEPLTWRMRVRLAAVGALLTYHGARIGGSPFRHRDTDAACRYHSTP